MISQEKATVSGGFLLMKKVFFEFEDYGISISINNTLKKKVEVEIMKIGEKLKEIRLSLGLSQREMAAGVINRSFYSRIETGVNRIMAKDLLLILNLHQIPFTTFFSSLGDVENKNTNDEDRVVLAYLNQDLTELKTILRDERVTNKGVKLVAKYFEQKIERKKIPAQFIHDLKLFLIQLDEWNEDKLWFLMCINDVYDYDDLQALVEVINNKCQTMNSNNERFLFLTASIDLVLYKRSLKEVKFVTNRAKILDRISALPNLTTLALPKLLAVYYYAQSQGDTESVESIAELLRENNYQIFID